MRGGYLTLLSRPLAPDGRELDLALSTAAVIFLAASKESGAYQPPAA